MEWETMEVINKALDRCETCAHHQWGYENGFEKEELPPAHHCQNGNDYFWEMEA